MIIQPGEIRANRKLKLPLTIRRLLLDATPEELLEGGQKTGIYWHYYDDDILAISDQIIDDEAYAPVHSNPARSITETLDDGRYIRPPGSVDEELLEQFYTDTQTRLELLAEWTGIDSDTLLDSYREDTGYFDSREAMEEALSVEGPRVAVFVVLEEEQSEDRTVVYVLSQQQAAELKPSAITEIIEDTAIFFALDAIQPEFKGLITEGVRQVDSLPQSDPKSVTRG